MNLEGKKVFVGLSGGVDSAVAAYLLKEKGVKVTGVFMKNWAGENGLQLECPWKEDQESAIDVANYLGIEFRSINFEEEYKEQVLNYFFSEYQGGRTPNPDILCNSKIKFSVFLDKAIALGADYIATGHYAAKSYLEMNTSLSGKTFAGYLLSKPKSIDKDQTYFLSALRTGQIAKSIFPLADLTKSEVRRIADEIGLPNSKRKDSQGICFIGDLDVQKFLRKYIASKPGQIVDLENGNVVGMHTGLSYYTIGQRKGLGIGGAGLPYYVSGKDVSKDILYVVRGKDNDHLYSEYIDLESIVFADDRIGGVGEIEVLASIRYRQKPTPAVLSVKKTELGTSIQTEQITIKKSDGRTSGLTKYTGIIKFETPQWAISPGQIVSIYLKSTDLENFEVKSDETGYYCIGSAVIG